MKAFLPLVGWAIALGFWGMGSGIAHAKEVLDLGKILIQGKMRGPEVKVIESDRLGQEAAENFLRIQLRNMEKELLQHEPPTTEANPQ